MKEDTKLRNDLKFSQCFKLPNPGLRSYFSKVREGNTEEYRTPFAKGQPLDKVLSDWESELSSIASKFPTLMDFENDLRSKVGPLSIQKPLKDRMEDIQSYYDSILLESEPIDDRAIKETQLEWMHGSTLRPASVMHTWEKMKKSTNSGSPLFTKRRMAADKTKLSSFWSNGKSISITTLQNGNEFVNVAVLGWRGQEGGPTDDDVKQRVVWMFPMTVNIQELRVYTPLIEYAQRFNLVPAWVSMDAVDESITKLFDTKDPNDLVVCTDFTKFDQHFNSNLQNAAYQLLSKLFTNNMDMKIWLGQVFPIKYAIPLAYDYGKIREGKHGMASGSGGTNADETLVHRSLQHEAALEQGKKLNPNSQCLGDDGILSYPGITVEDVLQSYTRHGLEMNESKQYASTQDCVYLRRWHSIDYRVDGVCVGVYSTYRAIGRLCEQERFYDPEKWSKEMVALRQLSIIENCKWHPLFKEFVEFCMKRDKYRLGLDIPGFLDNIDSIAQESIDLLPDFLGYTKSLQKGYERGISSWSVVKLLKSLRSKK